MQNLGVILRTFWEKAVSYLTLQMSLTDIIEIIIISVLIYYMLVWIKDTRAWMLLRGILVILAFVLLAVLLPVVCSYIFLLEFWRGGGIGRRATLRG